VGLLCYIADSDRDAILAASGITPTRPLPKGISVIQTPVQVSITLKLIQDGRGTSYSNAIQIPTIIGVVNTYNPPTSSDRVYKALVRIERYTFYTFNSDVDTYPKIVPYLNPLNTVPLIGVKASSSYIVETRLFQLTEIATGRDVKLEP
jgi:hypothetical protein